VGGYDTTREGGYGVLEMAVGHSEDVDAEDAAREVLAQCRGTLGDRSPQAGLLFAAVDMEHAEMLEAIHEAYPDLALIGCTTDGEISSQGGFLEDSVTLVLFAAEPGQIAAGLGRDVAADPVRATSEAVAAARAGLGGDASFCITTPESLTTSGVTILEGLKAALGKAFPIFGGLAGDQWRIQQTYQFFGTEVLSDAVPLLLFGADVLFAHAVDSGWKPVGHQRIVSRVEGNVVFELDDEPVLDFYERYLGAQRYEMVSAEYPLAVFAEDGSGYYLRSAFQMDAESRSIAFFGDVPAGSTVQLTETTSDAIIEAARTATKRALDAYPGSEPRGILVFSCAARKAILGVNTERELTAVEAGLTEPLPVAGFYTYGEIAPLRAGGETHFHNATFSILVVGDR